MGSKKSLRAVGVLLVLTAFGLVAAGTALADTTTVDFNSYSLGTINGQDGWSSLGAAGMGCATYDHAVAAQSTYPSFGSQSLRISNAVVSGCFGDQTFSKSLVDEAGEATAENGGMSGGTRQPYFDATWSFASATGAYQEGAYVVASPDRGDGARMSWVQIADTLTGLEVRFSEYTGGDFVQSTIASGLSHSTTHTVRITMHLIDGPGNDVVNVFVDGALVKTGTSWEDYYREVESNPTRTVDSIMFRTGGTAGIDNAPDTSGAGFLIDNLSLSSAATTSCAFATSGATMTLVDDCTTDQTILVPDGFTLDGDGHTITAVDPPAGAFLGAVVTNVTGASEIHVDDVTIQGASTAVNCGPFTGVQFEGAGGSLTDSSVLDIRRDDPDAQGCQTGLGVRVNGLGTAITVEITDSTIAGYQKNGITVNGDGAAAVITGNTVTGDGPVDYIAQNGIQVSRGATALIEGNSVSGNDYTPADTVACGLLYFEAQGVKQKKNMLFANEKDICNFGRGGGQYNPQS